MLLNILKSAGRDSKLFRIQSRTHKRKRSYKQDMEKEEGKSKDFSNLIGTETAISWENVKKGRKRTEADERREELLFRYLDEYHWKH
jgi:hypothetical protein